MAVRRLLLVFPRPTWTSSQRIAIDYYIMLSIWELVKDVDHFSFGEAGNPLIRRVRKGLQGWAGPQYNLRQETSCEAKQSGTGEMR